MSLYNKKKLEHKRKAEHGAVFGKAFNYEMGRKRAKNLALSRAMQKRREVLNRIKKTKGYGES